MNKRDKLKLEQDQRIVGYIKQRMTREEIGEREGWDSIYAAANRARVGKKYLSQSKFPGTKRTGPPFGLSQATHFLRFALGDRLENLGTRRNMHHLEISRDVGISGTNQKVANGFGSDVNRMFDWRLSQIERLARVLKVDPTQLIVNSLREELKLQAKKEKLTVGELVEKWTKESL